MKIPKKKTKIITICSSIKFKEEMIKVAMQMELEGNVVLIPIFPANNKNTCTEEEELCWARCIKKK